MKKILAILVLVFVVTVAHAAIVGVQVSFTANVEKFSIDYARMGLHAQGGEPGNLFAHCAATAKVAYENEFRRLAAVGRCVNDQNLKQQLDAIRTKDHVNALK